MILDSCIPDEFSRDFDALFKARVLIAMILVFTFILTSVEIWLFFIADAVPMGRIYGTLILLFLQAGMVISLLAIRIKGWFDFAANFTIFLSVAGITAGIAISGGPVVAPSTSMNIIPIIMSFVLISKRAGLIWTQIILTIHVAFMVMISSRYEFVQFLTPEMLPVQHLAHWLITYAAMIALMYVFDTLNSKLKEERDAEKQRFEHLASHDPLTKLANRLQFDICLTKSMNRGDRHNKMTALFFIDLDGFKPINDTLGHDAGDTVLREISERLESSVREMDTVARLGGDEFGIIIEDIGDKNQLIAIANKVLKSLAKPIKGIKSQPKVTGSIGIAIYPLHAADKEELVKLADTAMYEAKKEKNRFCMYSEDLEVNHN
jgi:diguanylate cyclase (GGDEF)-like protein